VDLAVVVLVEEMALMVLQEQLIEVLEVAVDLLHVL
jgi:hypothetical protein